MSIVSVNSENQVISIRGNLNKTSVEAELRESISLDAGVNYDLDLAELEKFDSAGLAYIMNLIGKHQQSNGSVQLINCSDKVLQLIELSELDDILSIKSN